MSLVRGKGFRGNYFSRKISPDSVLVTALEKEFKESTKITRIKSLNMIAIYRLSYLCDYLISSLRKIISLRVPKNAKR